VNFESVYVKLEHPVKKLPALPLKEKEKMKEFPFTPQISREQLHEDVFSSSLFISDEPTSSLVSCINDSKIEINIEHNAEIGLEKINEVTNVIEVLKEEGEIFKNSNSERNFDEFENNEGELSVILVNSSPLLKEFEKDVLDEKNGLKRKREYDLFYEVENVEEERDNCLNKAEGECDKMVFNIRDDENNQLTNLERKRVRCEEIHEFEEDMQEDL
jgi:hypothetical protein